MSVPSAMPHQLAELVEGGSPEGLQALKAALERLGQQLEAQDSHGQPDPEGKEVVDIREHWTEELYSSAKSARASAEQPVRLIRPGGADSLDDASSEASESEDSFEALMQRMEALEVEEAGLERQLAAQAAQQQANSGAAACQTPGSARQPAAHGRPGQTKQAARASGFKPGFLLGKRLEQPAAAGGHPSIQQQRPQSQQAASSGQMPPQQQQDQQHAARRENAFTGRIVERHSPGEAPQATGSAPSAAAAARPAAGMQRAGGPPATQAREAQPQRVSKFKLRMQGLAEG